MTDEVGKAKVLENLLFYALSVHLSASLTEEESFTIKPLILYLSADSLNALNY